MLSGELRDLDLSIVTTYGRSGSSRLMELLRLTGARRVAGAFPFEKRSVQFGCLCELGVGEVTAKGAIVFDGFPYPPLVPRSAGENEDGYRRRVLAERGHLRPYDGIADGPSTGAIAEKGAGLKLAQLLAETYPRVRFILIDRDPRDVFLSILAFNERRGFVSFGAEHGPLMLARRVARFYRKAGLFWMRHPSKMRVVNYGDLVSRPLRAVAQATGGNPASMRVDFDPNEISAPSHVTAALVEASVNRWVGEAERWPEEFERLAAAYAKFHERTAASGAPATPSVASIAARL